MPFKDLPEGQTQYLDENGKLVGQISKEDVAHRLGVEESDELISIKDSIKFIAKFEEDINNFLSNMQIYHVYGREHDILEAAKKLKKRVEKMRQFRETFK